MLSIPRVIAPVDFSHGGLIRLFPTHFGKQNHLGKETGRVIVVGLVFPVSTCKSDSVVRFQIDLARIVGGRAY